MKKESINYILPLTDPEVDVFNKFRSEIEKLNAIICISNKQSILYCRDKFLFQNLLRKHNIKEVIPTYLCSEIDYNAIKYPLVAKPIHGRSSQGLRYISSDSELEYFLKCIDKDQYIIQPKIGGRDSHIVTVDILRQVKYERFIALPRRELIRTVNGAGLTVETFYSQLLRLKEVGACPYPYQSLLDARFKC